MRLRNVLPNSPGWGTLTILSLLILLLLCHTNAQKRQQNPNDHHSFPQFKYIYDNDDTRLSSPPTPADDRTFISDIIGFSAFKLMFLFAIPMISSILLGAMLVLLFPFPLLTSTSGLAGAAAVGRRQGQSLGQGQGRISEMDETAELLRFLGLELPSNPVVHYYPEDNNGLGGYDEGGGGVAHTRVKKQFKTLPKMKRLQILASSSPSPPMSMASKAKAASAEYNKENEGCIKRIACEIGRENKDPHTRDLVGKMLNNLSPRSQRKWKFAIQAYLDGIQSQQGVIVSDSPSPSPPPAGPVYRHNFCPKYKCSL